MEDEKREQYKTIELKTFKKKGTEKQQTTDDEIKYFIFFTIYSATYLHDNFFSYNYNTLFLFAIVSNRATKVTEFRFANWQWWQYHFTICHIGNC